MFLVVIARCLRIAFLYNTSSGCFWQSYHGTVKSAGVPVFWFRASACFRFWSKTFTKRCSNNSLLSRDKSISSLLDLIGHVLLVSEYVLEQHSLFAILMKNLHKVLHKYVISRAKRLSSPALCDWSGAFSLRVWFGKRNMALKTPILILFPFFSLFLLCWLKKHLFCVLSLF